MNAEYTVKLPIFEGPLDLLLHLIKVNEMEITEISISQITSQYLETLRLLETLDLDVAGEFLVMAATLLNIKLRSILPEPEEEIEESEEEEAGDDYLSARALMQRLIEYRKFKEAALNLGGMAERRSLVFMREVALPAIDKAQADPAVRGDLSLLLEAFSRVIKFVQRRGYHEVQGEDYNVDDKIAMLRARMVIEERISVDELFSRCQVKIEMIVTLIALLELCRLKELRVSQIDSYGNIVAWPRRGDDAPAGDEADEAAQLKQLEAEILASRTGLVDNSAPPEDEEDVLLDEIIESVKAEAVQVAEITGETPVPHKEEAGPGEIVELEELEKDAGEAPVPQDEDEDEITGETPVPHKEEAGPGEILEMEELEKETGETPVPQNEEEDEITDEAPVPQEEEDAMEGGAEIIEITPREPEPPAPEPAGPRQPEADT